MAREPTDEVIKYVSLSFGGNLQEVQTLLDQGWTVKHLSTSDAVAVFVLISPSEERAAKQIQSGLSYTEQKQAEYKRRQEEYNKKKSQPVEKP